MKSRTLLILFFVIALMFIGSVVFNFLIFTVEPIRQWWYEITFMYPWVVNVYNFLPIIIAIFILVWCFVWALKRK